MDALTMAFEDPCSCEGAIALRAEVERLRKLLRQGRDLVPHATWDHGWPQEWVEAVDEALKEAGG